MGKLKPWQAVLFVLAVIAIGFSVYWTFFNDDVKVASSMKLADVNTGEMFTLPIGKGGTMVPGINPKTKEPTLIPVLQKDGKWVISEHYFPAVATMPGNHAAVDAATREIRTEGK